MQLESDIVIMFDCSRLKHPIIQAPMAGGTNTPEMVSAVINNGAVGSYGFAYSSPEQISNDLQAARRLMNPDAQGALNCNFFVFPETMEASPEDLEEALSTLKSIDFCKNIDLPVPEPPYHQNLDAQLEEIWKDRSVAPTVHPARCQNGVSAEDDLDENFGSEQMWHSPLPNGKSPRPPARPTRSEVLGCWQPER